MLLCQISNHLDTSNVVLGSALLFVDFKGFFIIWSAVI